MTVYKRKDNGIEQEEYSYSFTIDKKRYRGTCKGCTTKPKALEYEKIKRQECLDTLRTQDHTEAMLKIISKKVNTPARVITEAAEKTIENLLNKNAASIEDAYSRYLQKPARRQQIEINHLYYQDFAKFIKNHFPNILLFRDVKKSHAEADITHLRKKGVFDPDYTVKYIVGKMRKRERVRHYTRKNTKLSARSINVRHILLKSVFSRLAEDENMPFNPFNIPLLPLETIS